MQTIAQYYARTRIIFAVVLAAPHCSQKVQMFTTTHAETRNEKTFSLTEDTYKKKKNPRK